MALELILFDMDGTMVRYEGSYHSSWDAIGRAAGIWDQWKESLAYYIDKPELYPEWFAKNCSNLAGIPTSKVFPAIFPPPYAPGLKEFCTYLTEQGITQGIVSSGVDFVAEKLKQELNLDFAQANEVHIQEGYFTGTGRINVPLWKKGEVVKVTLIQQKTSPENTAFIGDNENDVSAWREVGLPLAINLTKNSPASNLSCQPHIQGSFDDFYQVKEFLINYLNQQ